MDESSICLQESVMSSMVFPEIRVSLDIGCRLHSVAVGLADGQLLDEFEIDHTKVGFDLVPFHGTNTK
jgi:hypothetical protein